MAKLPLKIAYRSGVRPGRGKDGQTVNARVMVEGWAADFIGPTKLGERPALEMHLALANLSHRGRRNNGSIEPLGLAADARWIWHEIGHVLLMASIGELEFRFAHSAGDALAAIVADPGSELAKDDTFRGATFPWVFIPRRHDRCVSQGWSWGGSLHHALSVISNAVLPRRKAYWSEQILSSSLFRLYRCLGGETIGVGSTAPDLLVRGSASHYSVYLIMRGIQILGDPGIVPTNDPDQFISALIDADIGTGQWEVTFPPISGPTFYRIGGCAHKVIRWAFEAQGMYTPAGTVTNAPGVPPPVDIYIEDLRPTLDAAPYSRVQYGPGGYVPVSLEWDPSQGESDEPPEWQATDDAINVSGDDISVTVRNRGSEPAENVEVSVWWHEWPDGMAEVPQWNDGYWNACTPATVKAASIDKDASAKFNLSHEPPRGRYLVLAQATCNDDRANTDPKTWLPCTQQRTPLVDLVANDNNLGLRVIDDLEQ